MHALSPTIVPKLPSNFVDEAAFMHVPDPAPFHLHPSFVNLAIIWGTVTGGLGLVEPRLPKLAKVRERKHPPRVVGSGETSRMVTEILSTYEKSPQGGEYGQPPDLRLQSLPGCSMYRFQNLPIHNVNTIKPALLA